MKRPLSIFADLGGMVMGTAAVRALPQLLKYCLVAAWFTGSLVASELSGQSVSLNSPPQALSAGQRVAVTVDYDSPNGGIVQIQLFTNDWNKTTESWKPVEKGASSIELTVNIPNDAKAAGKYLWQAVLYDGDWKKLKESSQGDVRIGVATSDNSKPAMTPSTKPTAGNKGALKGTGKGASLDVAASGKLSSGEEESDPTWLPAGEWTVDWRDEFDGRGEPENWFPLLGYDPDAFAAKVEKGIRWTGDNEESAWMYSTKSGNHWLDGNGNLVLRIVSDKTQQNRHGDKVKAAYLLSGYPEKWDKTEPNNAKWTGKFVSPADGPLYICARVKTNELQGYSTWFAFWLFTETRAYNGNPADGTEVDIIEIAKGKPDYMRTCFNVANHWKQANAESGPGSEAKQFNTASTPKALDFVDVTDEQFHTYGLLWSESEMKCFVDGKLYYTFTENVPSKPVDMMMMLTMEFQKNAWDPKQGDGRVDGPFVSDNDREREMSRVAVDFVRVYRQADGQKAKDAKPK